MDPNACLDLFRIAIAEGRLPEAREHAENYNAWRARGGFPATSNAQRVNRLRIVGKAGIAVMEGGATNTMGPAN